MNKEWSVSFDNNPLDFIPVEVVDRGKDAVLKYLLDLMGGDQLSQRLKLMFVGVENVGKTSLLRALREGPSLRSKLKKLVTGKGVRQSTEGIDIEEWTPNLPDPSNPSATGVTFAAWDFGGQEVCARG